MIALLIFLPLYSALTQSTTDKSVQPKAESTYQSGGVTAGWIGTLNQYVVASDIAPSLVTEVVFTKSQRDLYRLSLVLRNPSRMSVELLYAQYRINNEVIGFESSFGRSRIDPMATIQLPVGNVASATRGQVSIEVKFAVTSPSKELVVVRQTFPLDDNGNKTTTIYPETNVREVTGSPYPTTLFGDATDLNRTKGEYTFTLPGGKGEEASGGFETRNKYLLFSNHSNLLLFANNYKGRRSCLAVPLLPGVKPTRRIRIYWDDDRAKFGMSLDGVEVNSKNSAPVIMGGAPCDNKVTTKAQTLLRIWGAKAS